MFPPVFQPTCNQRASGDDTIVVTSPINPDDHDQCGDFISGLDTQLQSALSLAETNTQLSDAGVQLSSDEASQVENSNFLATTTSGSDTVWKNFRCAEFPGESQAHCQYVLPAKRLNVYPDGAELVFMDETREVNNPIFPIWLIQVAGIFGSDPTDALAGYHALCGNPISRTPGSLGGSRKFAQAVFGEQDFSSCGGDPCTCTRE